MYLSNQTKSDSDLEVSEDDYNQDIDGSTDSKEDSSKPRSRSKY